MGTVATSPAKAGERRSAGGALVPLPVLVAVTMVMWASPPTQAQTPLRTFETQGIPAAQKEDARAEADLQAGIALTRQGSFREAIPRFLAARGRVANEFVLDFNLALCYVADGQSGQAIPILGALRSSGRATADVYNLLAQAYLGNAQPQEAFKAFQQAVALNPKSERLYLLVADACLDHHYYSLGVDVLTVGLKHLHSSSRLYYQRGVFHSFMDRPDLAKGDLESASQLAPGSSISYLAAAQKATLDGNIPEATLAAREGVQKDPKNYILLTLLGQALIRLGAGPGEPEFVEAQTALERAVAERPNFAASRLALGQLYRMANRLEDATAHLDAARQLAPENTAVYSQLAMAYQKQGKLQEAQKMLAILGRLNQEQAAKYKENPPDQKASYLGSPVK